VSNNIVTIDETNAHELLIEESHKRPVLIDFWADWCEPCKNLMPVLEKLAAEYDGAFLLAKVNADEQQMIAGQFGVRSLPTVMLMKDGQPQDGFMGAQPETAVRELLEKYLPRPWDLQLEQARELIDQGNNAEAMPLLQQAMQASSGQADIAITLATVLIESNRLTDAQAALEQVKMVDQGPEYEAALAKLELAQKAGKAPEIEALEKKLSENPQDKGVAYMLAVQYSQHRYYAEALAQLYTIIASDLNYGDGEARKSYTDILALLGKGDPLAVEYQRKMYTLLY